MNTQKHNGSGRHKLKHLDQVRFSLKAKYYPIHTEKLTSIGSRRCDNSECSHTFLITEFYVGFTNIKRRIPDHNQRL